MATKTISITLYMSELIYDIQNRTYLIGRSRANGNNYEAVADIQADNEDESVNQIIRSIGNAFSLLKTKLSEYLTDCADNLTNALISPSDNLALVLTLPLNYDESTSANIANAIHQYLVNSALAEWLIASSRDDAKEYASMAVANIDEIVEAINKRYRPRRQICIRHA